MAILKTNSVSPSLTDGGQQPDPRRGVAEADQAEDRDDDGQRLGQALLRLPAGTVDGEGFRPARVLP